MVCVSQSSVWKTESTPDILGRNGSNRRNLETWYLLEKLKEKKGQGSQH